MKRGRPGEDDAMKDLSRQWRSVSPQTKRRYEEKAAQMTQERNIISKCGLDRADESELASTCGSQSGVLSDAQRKRMDQKRLDATLSKLADHSAWSFGLGLSDHQHPLRAKFVKQDLNASQASVEVEEIFGYNRDIVENQVTSNDLLRPCWTLFGGLCKKSKYYPLAVHMTNQLQVHLKAAKLDTTAALLHFGSGSGSEVEASSSSSTAPRNFLDTWCLLGCTVCRPETHVLIKLTQQRPSCFEFSMTSDGDPDLLTSQQLFQALARKHEDSVQCWEPARITVEVSGPKISRAILLFLCSKSSKFSAVYQITLAHFISFDN